VAGGDPAADAAPLAQALVEFALGVTVGVVIGAGGARLLVSARRTSGSNAAGERLAVLILPVLTYLTAAVLGATGSLLRSGLGTREVLFLGWIGPRGLASILFGLIAIEDLHAHGQAAAADLSPR